jgi:hypothetical protein
VRVVELLLLPAADGKRFVPFQNHRVIENQRNLPSPGTERRLRAPVPPVVVGQVPHHLSSAVRLLVLEVRGLMLLEGTGAAR